MIYKKILSEIIIPFLTVIIIGAFIFLMFYMGYTIFFQKSPGQIQFTDWCKSKGYNGGVINFPLENYCYKETEDTYFKRDVIIKIGDPDPNKRYKFIVERENDK